MHAREDLKQLGVMAALEEFLQALADQHVQVDGNGSVLLPQSSWVRTVILALVKVLAIDLMELLVRSVSNPRVLLA